MPRRDLRLTLGDAPLFAADVGGLLDVQAQKPLTRFTKRPPPGRRGGVARGDVAEDGRWDRWTGHCVSLGTVAVRFFHCSRYLAVAKGACCVSGGSLSGE